MRTLSVVAVVILFEPFLVHAQSTYRTDLHPLFADEYDYPVAECYETGIADLLRCATYESSQRVADPLISDCWLVTHESQRYQCDIDGFREAFSILGFAPSTEEDVLTTVGFFVPTVFEDEYVIADLSHTTYWGLPAEIESTIAAPLVSQDGDIFTIEVFTIWVNNSRRWHDVDTETVVRFRTVEIGPEHLTMPISEELWLETRDE